MLNVIKLSTYENIPFIVFSGENDVWFGPLAPEQAALFNNVTEVHSNIAGHDLPTSTDPTFQATVDFIRQGLNQ